MLLHVRVVWKKIVILQVMKRRCKLAVLQKLRITEHLVSIRDTPVLIGR